MSESPTHRAFPHPAKSFLTMVDEGRSKKEPKGTTWNLFCTQIRIAKDVYPLILRPRRLARKNPSTPDRSRTFDFLVSSPEAPATREL